MCLLFQILANNLSLAAATFLTGNNFAKIAQFCSVAGLAFIKENSFFNIQKNVVCPCLQKLWAEHVESALEYMPPNVTLCGDGRCDSPGHSAKLLVYPLMEHDSGRIIHLQFADKRQVGGHDASLLFLSYSY